MDSRPTDHIRRAATVRGRVQGVSFRWYTRQEADRLGLTGWVRNEADGTVRLEAQGVADDVEALLRWVRHGPAQARVTAVDVEERPTSGDEVDFSIDR
jgi:acylphosphatase